MTSPVQEVGVDHGRRDILVTQEFLDGSDIAASVEHMRGKWSPSPRGSASGRSGGCSAGTARLRRSVGEVLRPGKDRAANPTWSPPNAKRPPGTWCVARDRAELVAQAEACAGHSSCVPQAPASDRPPLALPENRWNGLTLVQACRPCQGRRRRQSEGRRQLAGGRKLGRDRTVIRGGSCRPAGVDGASSLGAFRNPFQRLSENLMSLG